MRYQVTPHAPEPHGTHGPDVIVTHPQHHHGSEQGSVISSSPIRCVIMRVDATVAATATN